MPFLGMSLGKKSPNAGKPTPPVNQQSVPFGDLGRAGVIYEREDLDQANADVTATANTGASTDETWLNVLNPTTTARFIKQGVHKMILYVATSAPAQIVAGSVAFFIANNNSSRVRLVNRIDLRQLAPLADQRSALFSKTFPFNIALAPNYRLLVKVNSASTLATAQSFFSVADVIKATNVTLEDFKAHYSQWLLT